MQSPFSSVYDRIAPYTVTDMYDRNKVTCITAKYGRKRPNTECVNFDLGCFNSKAR